MNIISTAVQQGIRKRAHHRLGMLRTDRTEDTPTVGHVNGFMPDVAEITAAVAEQEFVGPR